MERFTEAMVLPFPIEPGRKRRAPLDYPKRDTIESGFVCYHLTHRLTVLRLWIFEEQRYRVAAVVDKSDSCPAIGFLLAPPKQYQASADGMIDLFKRYARAGKGGRQGLTTAQMHHADTQESIWEFIRGDLRVFCFKDDNGLVVLTSTHIKKGQKADRKAVAEAVRLKKAYLADKSKGLIEYIGENTGEDDET